MSSVEEKFNAAVNVIRGLPKNGSYQPSNDMMLRFYSYFKQGTLGPCTQKKPAFYDVVNRAKWSAWKSLGNMPRDIAMEHYVEELKKIIETMSYTDNVAQFMGSISELDGINVDDLEAVAPDAIKKVRSHPNSPFGSREASPIRGASVVSTTSTITSKSSINKPNMVNGNGVTHNQNGNGIQYQNGYTVEHSDDEYIDTVEDESDITNYRTSISSNNSLDGNSHTSRTKSKRYQSQNGDTLMQQHQQLLQNNHQQQVDNRLLNDVINKLNKTIELMNIDVQQLTNRLNIVERSFSEYKNLQQVNFSLIKSMNKYPKWWPFKDISPNWFLFMLMYPIIIQRITYYLQRKK